MRKIVLFVLSMCCGLAATAAEAFFDFANPESLNPAVPTPAVKEGINMHGRVFTDNGVEVSFEAAATGNTHVRIYGSYDAGTDLRIYDDDTMLLRTIEEGALITGVHVTISFSGNADAWFLPSAGEWIWEEDSWVPDEGSEGVSELALVSFKQSRITTLTVTTTGSAGVGSVVADVASPEYYTLQGVRVQRPTVGGVYIERIGSSVKKLIMR